jgi:L-seryl-tRNA(Ser) seleniumtransferase
MAPRIEVKRAFDRRDLPSVDRLARELREADPALPAWCATWAARGAVAEARAALAAGDEAPDPRRLAAERARFLARPRPGRVVNATGVVLHTNLGRSVLGAEAAQAVAEVASRYTDLELDLESGQRGTRLGAVADMLAILGGAEAGWVVNNNAAAVLLALDTLARGREVVVSRGELVEIGGSFRVPEILERAGVRLVEVGTTNRTHPDDYRGAIGPETGLLLKVHRSNFEQRGFVKEVPLAELVAIGAESGVPVVEDLGSGTLVDLRAEGLPEESWVPGRVATGVDLVCLSGDKLLGGPQAGLLLGRRDTIERLRSSPLARALRLDKLSLAALDRTLRAQLEGRALELPTLRQLTESAAVVEARAKELWGRLRDLAAGRLAITLEPTRAAVGGGSLPGFELDSWAVCLRPQHGAERLAGGLRAAPVPVLARVSQGAVWLDARTLLPGDDLDACEVALATVLATHR